MLANQKIGEHAKPEEADQADADVLYPDVVYSTGFEAPTYTTGTLSGQDGWL